MLDFYEGEALRRTILIRNAMRRTEAITQEALKQQQRQQKHSHRKKSTLSPSDTDLFYGDLNAGIGEGEPIRPATSSAPVRVQITDYDYESESEIDDARGQKLQNTILEDDEYEDDATEDEDDDGNTSDEDDEAMLARHGHIIEEGVRVSVTSVVKDEHSWFDDLLDEVSIDESKPRSFVQRVHPADQEIEDEDQSISSSLSSIESSIESLSIHDNSSINANIATNPSLPALVEDEDESSGNSSADEYDVEDAFAQHYTNRFGKGVNYFGGADLSASTKSHRASFTQPSPDTILGW